MNVFNVKQLFYKNALYFTYKLNIIEFKQITRTTRKNDKITIPTIKTLKSSRFFGKVDLELINNFAPHILNCQSHTQNSNFL